MVQLAPTRKTSNGMFIRLNAETKLTLDREAKRMGLRTSQLIRVILGRQAEVFDNQREH